LKEKKNEKKFTLSFSKEVKMPLPFHDLAIQTEANSLSDTQFLRPCACTKAHLPLPFSPSPLSLSLSLTHIFTLTSHTRPQRWKEEGRSVCVQKSTLKEKG